MRTPLSNGSIYHNGHRWKNLKMGAGKQLFSAVLIQVLFSFDVGKMILDFMLNMFYSAPEKGAASLPITAKR